jgi:hypothetical protein
MVREVTIQDPLQPPTHDRHRFVPPLVELVADRGQRCSHTLLGRQSHDLELPLLVRPTTVREAQKVERFRSALPPLAPPLARIPAKLDQPRLIRMQSQPELRQTFSQIR